MTRILKNLFVFISYFLYEYFFIIILYKFGIDYYSLSYKRKIVLVSILNLSYILLLFILYKKEIDKDIKDYKENYSTYINKYLWIYLSGVLLMGFSNLILQNITKLEMSGNEVIVRNLIKEYPIYMFFSSIIYAPFVEEMIFRKIIKNVAKKKYLFILLSGFIFGILHISDYSNINEILMGIPYVIMGLDFAYIYYKTDNIFTTMTFHLFHNFILILFQLF